MSQVSKERIIELQKIIKKEYEKEVSFEEASKIANGLVGYFDTLAKINHGTVFVHNKETSLDNNEVMPIEKIDSGT